MTGEHMVQVGERVNPDGTSEAITVPDLGHAAAVREAMVGQIALHVRTAIALAAAEAGAGREPHHRQMAIVRTELEAVLLRVLFGDRL